ncbi:aminotransferase class III-fold pyridoxal phosphate-dependent enzyme, partial [Sphingomonas sp.]|uniref:aminotransferase class III-fold pyridoxal phosphate-dependent enzyme n=1 Tax=Sphingomonas sp. TaxID=28214 RepID=UPI002FC6677C
FSDSGSTSVEVALKMALGYWANRGEPRHRILVLDHGYHGDTIGGMSVGARGVFNAPYAPLLFDVGSLPFPHAGQEQATLDALETYCRAPEAPAALIVEPLICGAGGMLIYAPEVLAEMSAICARHHVLFIADEVMTGWGRTGSLLACEQAGIVPDIICLSKGLTGGALPLAVTVATPEIFEAHHSPDRAKMFFHSSSYTANPIACAAARANLEIWRDEPVIERIAALSALQRTHLDRLAALPGVSNARAIGTITALEVGAGNGDYLSSLGPRLLAFFGERDLLVRPLGNTIYVMPPYCILAADLAAVHDAVADAVEWAARGAS